MKKYEVYVDTKFCQWELQKYIINTDIETPSYEDFLKIIVSESNRGKIEGVETIKTYDTIEVEGFEEPEDPTYPKFREVKDNE